MAIEITSLSQLGADAVGQSLTQTTQRVQEVAPNVDAKRGVFHDLLLYLHAQLDAQVRAGVIARYLSARSLADIEADPTLADDGVVDAVLSNWGVARGQGARASGVVQVVVTTSTSVTIAAGAAFAANGKSFTSDAAYTAKTEAAQVTSATDRLMRKLSDGTWAFTIDVTAAEAGVASAVPRNTLVVPTVKPAGYVTSYAASDFSGGLDPQTNGELLDVLQQGIACKAPSNRVNMQAMLLAQPAFARVVRSSIVGAGDAEMLRDQHTIWPGGVGGRADWYVRTTSRLTRTKLSKPCTLLSVAGDVGTWQFSLGRDEVPGFYEVVSVAPSASAAAGGLTLTADVRDLDLTPVDGAFVPDLRAAAEGAYTRFQTAVVRFADDVTANQAGMTLGAVASYDVTVSRLEQVADVQDFVSGDDVRSYGADVLVKAPVPCFVTVYFRVAKNRRQPDPDLDAIREAAADAVNAVDFTGRLYAADVLDAIAPSLSVGMSVGSIKLLGRMRRPDGSVQYFDGDELLVVDAEDGTMVGPHTVQFFADPSDVNVTVSTEIPVAT